MLIKIPHNALLSFSHLFVLGVCWVFFPFQRHTAWEPTQQQPSLSCSNEAVRDSVPCFRASWHYSLRPRLLIHLCVCLLIKRFFSWMSNKWNTTYKLPVMHILCISPADNSFECYSVQPALGNLNTNLKSQSSSRLPDSSCSPDSWKERGTWLLPTVPRGDCAKEQQQSIKHAAESWTSAILSWRIPPHIY